MRYKIPGTKWYLGQSVTIIGLPYTIIGPGGRKGLVKVRRRSDDAEFDAHEHSLAEHPHNGGNYGE